MENFVRECAELGHVNDQRVIFLACMSKFTNYEDVADKWMAHYMQFGHLNLPPFIKEYCEKTCEILRANQYPAHA